MMNKRDDQVGNVNLSARRSVRKEGTLIRGEILPNEWQFGREIPVR